MDSVTGITQKRWKEKQDHDRHLEEKISAMINARKPKKPPKHGTGNSATKRHKRKKK